MIDYDIVKYILIGYWALLMVVAMGLACWNGYLLRRTRKNYEESIEALKFAHTALDVANDMATAIKENEPLTSEEN